MQDAWLRFARRARAAPQRRGVPGHRDHAPGHRPAALRPRAPGDLRRPVAARADRRRPRAARPRRRRRGGRAAQPRAAHRARAPQPRRARGLRCCATCSTSTTPRSPTRRREDARRTAARSPRAPASTSGEPARRRPVDARGGAARADRVLRRRRGGRPRRADRRARRRRQSLYSDGGGVVPAARKLDLRRGEVRPLRCSASGASSATMPDVPFVRVNGDPGVRIHGGRRRLRDGVRDRRRPRRQRPHRQQPGEADPGVRYSKALSNAIADSDPWVVDVVPEPAVQNRRTRMTLGDGGVVGGPEDGEGRR